MTVSLGITDLSKGVIPPPPGVTPNFVNPTHRTGSVIACNTILLSLTLVFVGARLWTKIYITRSLGWDDFTCLAALLLSIGHTACVLAAQNYGIGIDEWNISGYMFQGFDVNFNSPRWFLFQYLFFILAIGLAKLSILLLYLRIVPTGQRKTRISTYIVMAITIGAVVALEISYIFACKPFSFRWDGAGGDHAVCFDVSLHSISNEVINMVTDIAMIVIPIPMVWRLQLSTRKKIGVILIFATGLLTIAVAAIRVAITVRLKSGETNVSFTLWQYNMTGVIQLYVAIICCCLPTLKAFIKSYIPRIHGPSTSLLPSRTSGPETKLSNRSSKGRNRLDTIDEIMLETGTRSPDGTYMQLNEARERDETFVLESRNICVGASFDADASNGKIKGPWHNKGITKTVSIVTGER